MPPPAEPRRGGTWLVVLVVLAAAAGWLGWRQWQSQEHSRAEQADVQIDALMQRVDTVRSEQRSHSRRLQQADSLNRVLRDELNGIGQRAALLEESVAKLADSNRHGAQALRLDEAEMLLTLGAQRLDVAGDLDGARRAYALAEGVLAGIDDPAFLSLRQTLQQERAGLDALGADPRVRAIARLEVFARQVTAPAGGTRAATPAQGSWWERAFGNLVRVQPTDRAVAVQPADRAAALAGLQLEISLARAAAERRDRDGYRGALSRADAWLQRLTPGSAELARQRAALRQIAALPLTVSLPTLGSTLVQLRQLRTR
ncbi:uroporphyrinogen-III C-methyltransferase [Lysobacter solisilvae]|uniref:Uroporphyrinogen-III C-methyltransferase n=1 Tax=Agrilutibacter solisilvae TaxID=2763317 RepID=A0A974Y1Z0_9GAMM|nr:uroporphyrinogen-III C-methyltransferase [Lysobacter solisilvae]